MLFKVFATIKDVIVEIVLLPFRILGGIVKGIIALFKKDDAADRTTTAASTGSYTKRTSTKKSK